MVKKGDDTSQLLGMELFSRQRVDLLDQLEERLTLGKKLTIVFTPNPEQVVQAKHDSGLNSYFNQADYLLPDGVGLVLASRILALRGKAEPLSGTIKGVDLVDRLLLAAEAYHWKVLVVGGRGYSQDDLIEYAGQTLHWTPGYHQVARPTSEEEAALVRQIKTLRPVLVFVAFGAPHQERWIIEHRELLEESGVKLAMAVGGSFDYLLGKVSRAPQWVRTLGMEWFYRLLTQPWRWKRQLRLVEFIGLVLRELVS